MPYARELGLLPHPVQQEDNKPQLTDQTNRQQTLTDNILSLQLLFRAPKIRRQQEMGQMMKSRPQTYEHLQKGQML
jgi:hypothetical protein